MVQQETFTKESFWATLDELGEDEVRLGIATKRYGSANHKLELANEWLRAQEHVRADRIATSNLEISLESLRIAKSAKNASWAAGAIATFAILILIALA